MTTLPDTQAQGAASSPDGDYIIEVKNLKMYFPVSSGILFHSDLITQKTHCSAQLPGIHQEPKE